MLDLPGNWLDPADYRQLDPTDALISTKACVCLKNIQSYAFFSPFFELNCADLGIVRLAYYFKICTSNFKFGSIGRFGDSMDTSW